MTVTSRRGILVVRRSDMNTHVLVAYATKRGSTAEVAEAIAATLREDGHAVDVLPAALVYEVGTYGTVVLGGALYMGRWHRDAVRFLARHRHALATVPLAIFAMGPRTLAEDDLAGARAQLDRALARFPDVEPSTVAIFGGVIDPAKLHFPFSRIAASDARDWDAIDAWADDFAHAAPSIGG
jgi:menaquinone-dependent protoporphyrinogen oxidase